MGHTITQLPSESVVIAKFTNPFDALKDSVAVAAFLTEHLRTTAGQIYYIADMSGIKITFFDLVQGMSQSFTDPTSPYANSRLTTLTVAGDLLISLGVKAASEQQQYGKVNVKLYRTVDQALAQVRKLSAKTS